MALSPISSLTPALPMASVGDAQSLSNQVGVKNVNVPQEFEAIMLRQFLGESMKPLLESGEAGKVYGYLVTDTLASTLAKSGGLGLSSVIQAQLGGDK